MTGDQVYRQSTLKKITGVRNIEDFGAVGDDETDNTDAIQAAFDDLPFVDDIGADYLGSGGMVLIPRGIFRFGDELLLDTPYSTIMGCGHNSVLRWTGDNNTKDPLTLADVQGRGHMLMQHLRIDTDFEEAQGDAHYGVVIKREATLYDVWIEYINCARLLSVQGNFCRVLFCVIYDNDSAVGDGIVVDAVDDVWLINNWCEHSDRYQMNLSDAQRLKVIGNELGNGQMGIRAGLVNDSILTNNILRALGRQAIQLEGSSDNDVSHNRIHNAGIETDATYDAIKLMSFGGTHSTYNQLLVNRIRSEHANEHKYGIEEVDVNQDYNIMLANIISQHTVAGIRNLGVNSEVDHSIATVDAF